MTLTNERTSMNYCSVEGDAYWIKIIKTQILFVIFWEDHLDTHPSDHYENAL